MDKMFVQSVRVLCFQTKISPLRIRSIVSKVGEGGQSTRVTTKLEFVTHFLDTTTLHGQFQISDFTLPKSKKIP